MCLPEFLLSTIDKAKMVTVDVLKSRGNSTMFLRTSRAGILHRPFFRRCYVPLPWHKSIIRQSDRHAILMKTTYPSLISRLTIASFSVVAFSFAVFAVFIMWDIQNLSHDKPRDVEISKTVRKEPAHTLSDARKELARMMKKEKDPAVNHRYLDTGKPVEETKAGGRSPCCESCDKSNEIADADMCKRIGTEVVKQKARR